MEERRKSNHSSAATNEPVNESLNSVLKSAAADVHQQLLLKEEIAELESKYSLGALNPDSDAALAHEAASAAVRGGSISVKSDRKRDLSKKRDSSMKLPASEGKGKDKGSKKARQH